MENSISKQEQNQSIVLKPESTSEIMSLDDAQRQFENLGKFIKTQMRQDVDYGTIPGCPKPSLYKPGAEKLLYFHGLGCRLEPTTNCTMDWNNDFFIFEYKAIVYSRKTQLVYSEAFGSCNSKEDKYVKQIKARGITNADIVNTLQKMAQKRAFIGAVLLATRASANFTHDLDEEQASGSGHSKEEELRTSIRNSLLDINKGNKDQAQAHLETVTAFDAKDGTRVKGVKSVLKLSGKRLEVVHGKVSDEYKEWEKMKK